MTPEEIVDRLFDVYEEEQYSSPVGLRDRIAAAIRAAVAEERERCAQVADRHAAEKRKSSVSKYDEDLIEAGAADDVAARIRAGDHP